MFFCFSQYACQNNFISTVRLLIQKGQAQVQIRNAETGWVALHEAASRGLSEVVQVLLSLNAPAHPRTPQGETPITIAQKGGYWETVEILRKFSLKLMNYVYLNFETGN